MATIIQLSNTDAEKFFLRAENYCTIDLPKYFNFQPLLDALSNNKSAIDTIGKNGATKYEGVNYKFYNTIVAINCLYLFVMLHK